MQKPAYSRFTIALVFIAACAVSTGAIAHIGTDFHSHLGFQAGFLNPVGGLDHLA